MTVGGSTPATCRDIHVISRVSEPGLASSTAVNGCSDGGHHNAGLCTGTPADAVSAPHRRCGEGFCSIQPSLVDF
jgi:hypothetical protein